MVIKSPFPSNPPLPWMLSFVAGGWHWVMWSQVGEMGVLCCLQGWGSCAQDSERFAQHQSWVSVLSAED